MFSCRREKANGLFHRCQLDWRRSSCQRWDNLSDENDVRARATEKRLASVFSTTNLERKFLKRKSSLRTKKKRSQRKTSIRRTRKISNAANAAVVFSRRFVKFNSVPKINAERNAAVISNSSELNEKKKFVLDFCSFFDSNFVVRQSNAFGQFEALFDRRNAHRMLFVKKNFQRIDFRLSTIVGRDFRQTI